MKEIVRGALTGREGDRTVQGLEMLGKVDKRQVPLAEGRQLQIPGCGLQVLAPVLSASPELPRTGCCFVYPPLLFIRCRCTQGSHAISRAGTATLKLASAILALVWQDLHRGQRSQQRVGRVGWGGWT